MLLNEMKKHLPAILSLHNITSVVLTLESPPHIIFVAYYSTRQSTAALCTAMVETMALTKLVVKVKHMIAFMEGLTHPLEGKTVINSMCVWTNNTASLSGAKSDK